MQLTNNLDRPRPEPAAERRWKKWFVYGGQGVLLKALVEARTDEEAIELTRQRVPQLSNVYLVAMQLCRYDGRPDRCELCDGPLRQGSTLALCEPDLIDLLHDLGHAAFIGRPR